MKLNSSILLDELSHLGVHEGICTDPALKLLHAKMFRSDVSLNSETIYVIKQEDLTSELARSENLSWFCIGRPNTSIFELISKAKSELIYVDSALSPIEVLESIDSIFARFSSWNDRLATTVLKNNAYMPEMCSVAIEYLENPFIIINAYGLLAHQEGSLPDDFGDETWIKTISGEPDISTTKRIWMRPASAISSTTPFFVDSKGSYRLLGINIIVDDIRQARFLFCESSKPFTKGYLSIVQHIAELTTLATKRLLAQEEVGDISDNYFRQLLSGTPPNRQLMEFQLGSIGWDLSQNARVLLVREKQTDNSCERSFTFMRGLLARAFPSILSFVYRGDLVSIVPDEGLSPLLMAKRIQECVGASSYRCGVSELFYDFTHLKKHFDQCVFVLGYQDYGNVSFYDLHYFDDYLRMTETEAFAPQIIHPSVMKLYQYDQENGTHLVKTLAGFIESCGNKSDLAAIEYVHYNTLSYRLNRIEQICGFNFKDIKQMLPLTFHLLISCKLLINDEDRLMHKSSC